MRTCSTEGCSGKYYGLGLCKSHYDSARHYANPERTRAKNVRNYHANPEKAKSKVSAWRLSNPEKKMLITARQRARTAGVPCTITHEDIRIPETCPLLGVTLNRVGEARRPENNDPSLDRIIPHLGYVPGNVMVVSVRANRLKSDASVEELHMLTQNLESIVKATTII